ncbi:substrate-binding periplasmic protein [Candidatus Neptunochlamydia vexilliferae]|uniref:Solute-binding protein family 3/N-terminal domain-containing protein n=1 Tax=Candidatus Neptunichlamydia vexilliferae TaxID=1651774 RepID=A0ABS0AZ40_9BACT|nr:transporter substrate-binding domain-containing protein [Candidatus Neptunochlamydia vexilliferae]MBF5059398.1 hypothetical protein [Candidatus Neptunochlamydia vexilliferae]
MIKRYFLLFFILMVAVSCGTTSRGKSYTIAIDPSWFPLDLQGKEPNIYAFSSELLRAISHKEGVFFEKIRMDWDNLALGLEKGDYDGMLSSLTPRVFWGKTYTFSDPFLHTGPVLVIREEEKIRSLDGKEIAVDSFANEAILIEKFPGVIIQYYTVIPEGLDEVLSGQLDGVLINYLQATSYIRDLYHGQVKIAMPPLDDAGLRLITLDGGNTELVEIFNRGLDKLKDDGTLDKLLAKWELN